MNTLPKIVTSHKRGHNVHAVSHGGFCRHEADKVPQCLFRSAKVLKIRCTTENANGKE